MCQAYEGERGYLVSKELREIKETYEAHVSGEKSLTEDEIRELAIRKLMLLE